MIRYERAQIPPFTAEEDHGLLIAFLARRFPEDADSRDFLESVGIYFSGFSGDPSFSGRIEGRGGIGTIDTLETNAGLDPDTISSISRESALKYVSDTSLQKFEAYHPQDQFAYLYDVYYDYGAWWPVRRDNKCCNTFVFCSGCHHAIIATTSDDREEIYDCEEMGCLSTYCQKCVSSKPVLEYLSNEFSAWQWYNTCRCRKHASLFDALYTVLFLEPESDVVS